MQQALASYYVFFAAVFASVPTIAAANQKSMMIPKYQAAVSVGEDLREPLESVPQLEEAYNWTTLWK